MKKKLICLIILSVLLTGCGEFLQNAVLKIRGKLPTKEISLQTDKEKVALKVEVADSAEERIQGLMNRKKVAENEGMLFIFEDEAQRSFWMKKTLVPLDIIFFDKNKKAVKVIKKMEPCTVPNCPLYNSDKKAMYALETAAGFAEKHGVKTGDTVTF